MENEECRALEESNIALRRAINIGTLYCVGGDYAASGAYDVCARIRMDFEIASIWFTPHPGLDLVCVSESEPPQAAVDLKVVDLTGERPFTDLVGAVLSGWRLWVSRHGCAEGYLLDFSKDGAPTTSLLIRCDAGEVDWSYVLSDAEYRRSDAGAFPHLGLPDSVE